MSSLRYFHLLSALALAGCFDPEIAVGLRCGPGDECPEGQACVAQAGGDSICTFTSGEVVDAGPIPVLSFRDAVDYDVGTNPRQLVVADLTGDLFPDLIVAGGAIDGNSEVKVLVGQSGGSFSPAFSFPAGTEARSVAVGNIDGQAGLDLAYLYDTGSGGQEVAVVLQDPNESFKYLPPAVVPVPEPEFWESIHLSELSGDERLDIAQHSTVSEFHGVLVQGVDGTFTEKRQITGFPETSEILLSDVDDDGRDDLLSATSSGTYLSLQSTAPGDFAAALQLDATQSEQVLVTDSTVDGRLDVLAVTDAQGPGSVSLMLQEMNVPGSFLAPLVPQELSLSPRIAAADLDGDSRPDLVSMTGPVAIQDSFQVSTFTESDAIAVDLDASPVDVVTGDWNRDNKTDVAVLHGETGGRNGFVRVFVQE